MIDTSRQISKKFRCPDCGVPFSSSGWLISHIETTHKENFYDSNWTARQYLFHRRNKTNTPSKCVVCKAYTQWNEESGKYKRLCENASCKAELARRAKENMRKRYGKDHLLNDPEMQRKMLSGRSISGSYKFRDGKTVIGYNSSYEQDFLEFIDTDLELNPSMISQCPIIFTYKDEEDEEKQDHFYIPDYWFEEWNLVVEIKDGGDNPNNHPNMQNMRRKEKLKDDAVKSSKQYNYIKIVNKDYSHFIDMIKILRDRPINDGDKCNPIIIIP